MSDQHFLPSDIVSQAYQSYGAPILIAPSASAVEEGVFEMEMSGPGLGASPSQSPSPAPASTDRQIEKLRHRTAASWLAARAHDRENAFRVAAGNGVFRPRLTLDEDEAFVKDICEAILSTDRVQAELSALGRPRQAVALVRNPSLCPDFSVEDAAWEILLKAKDGFVIPTTKAHHNVKREEFETFAEYMEAIMAALKDSKDLVKRIMDPDVIEKFLEQPVKTVKNTKANSKLNEKRNRQVIAGRLSLAAQAATTPSANIESSSTVAAAVFPAFSQTLPASTGALSMVASPVPSSFPQGFPANTGAFYMDTTSAISPSSYQPRANAGAFSMVAAPAHTASSISLPTNNVSATHQKVPGSFAPQSYRSGEGDDEAKSSEALCWAILDEMDGVYNRGSQSSKRH